MKIMCIFPSGRILDRTALGEDWAAMMATEFPSINYYILET